MADRNLPTLPEHPADLPWPTREWPTAPVPTDTDRKRLETLLHRAFDEKDSEELGQTHACVIIKDGALVLERYGDSHTGDMTYPSWSMAKSITQALVGVLVRDGRIDVHAPADVPEWQGDDDPRRSITLDQLLRMSSGLKFTEEYSPEQPSDVIEMLFGSGKADTAGFAASFPLTHTPDTFWSYASGTTNIISRCIARTLHADADQFRDFMFQKLFNRLGMRSPIPKFDDAGTFIGSSFCYCTARDFAKFGLLYLRNGIWDGTRILPEGWVDYARTPTPTPPEEPMGYGAQWWLGICGPGSFSANGFEGQYIVLIPELDLIIVRHGKSEAQKDNVRAWLAEVADCFRS